MSPFKNERFYIRGSGGLPPEAEEFLNFHSWRRLIFGPLYHESSRCAFSGWEKSTRQFGEWNLTFTRQAIFFTRQWRVVKPFSPSLFASSILFCLGYIYVQKYLKMYIQSTDWNFFRFRHINYLISSFFKTIVCIGKAGFCLKVKKM